MKRRKPPYLAEMNITSLADVSFTLMVIFLMAGVSTAFSRNQGVDLELPRTSSVQPQTKEGIEVSIQAGGQIFVGKKATTVSGFAKALGEQLSRGNYDRAYLRADKSVDYGVIMSVLGDIREQGITNIGLVALPK
ncbi:MAG: biopolymer transporter ExbD [candidate division WOR-3 bacterium]|nr:biopolymer transporter ExbD [candidate division WOR-3 bacterium]